MNGTIIDDSSGGVIDTINTDGPGSGVIPRIGEELQTKYQNKTLTKKGYLVNYRLYRVTNVVNHFGDKIEVVVYCKPVKEWETWYKPSKEKKNA